MIECDDDFELNLSFGGSGVAKKKPKNVATVESAPRKKVLLRRNETPSSSSSSLGRSSSDQNTSSAAEGGPGKSQSVPPKTLRRAPDTAKAGKVNTTTGLLQHKVPVIGNKAAAPLTQKQKQRQEAAAAARASNADLVAAATAASLSSSQDKEAKSRGREELDDPMQFHARPKDLSKDAGGIKEVSRSEYIFTRQSFSSLKMPAKVVELLEKDVASGGFSLRTATRVQSAVIPALLSAKQNVLMKSETGSGKTLAYLLPVLADLLALQPPVNRSQGTFAIVLAPTRELCSQIADVVDRLTKCCVSVVGGCITGGARRKSEKARLRKGVNILVGSPGRMLDHLKATESFNLNNLRWMVLDEADRLLDMGFEQTIMEICAILRGSSEAASNTPGAPPAAGEVLLVPPEDPVRDAAKDSKDSKTPLKILDINQKWREQSLTQSKLCSSFNSLSYVMVSATLTSALKRISFPVMGSRGFTVVDAEKETSERVETLADLATLGRDTGRLDGKVGQSHRPDKAPTREERGDEHEDEDEDGFEVVREGEEGRAPAGAMGDKKSKAKKERSSDLAVNEQISTPSQLSQYFMMVTCKWRLAALLCFLKMHAHEKVMVFFATCDSVDYHALLMHNAKWPQELDAQLEIPSASGAEGGGKSKVRRNEKTGVWSHQEGSEEHLDPLGSNFSSMILEESMLEGAGASDGAGAGVAAKGKATTPPELNNMYRLHGNVPQRVRQEVYKKFCKAKSGILFCTDVAARGLDLPKIDWIVQYDAPCETTDYVHRIGRTARRGEGGNSLIFVLPSEAQYLTLLASHGVKPEPLSLQKLFVQVGEQHIPGSQKFTNRDEMAAVILQRRIETVVLGNKFLLQASRQAFRSFIRAYATHSADTKGIFKIQALHLGHVAKCFGLRESPSALRNHDDVIGKVFNGMFTKEYLSENKLTKKARDEKYALSKTSGGNSSSSSGGKKKRDRNEDSGGSSHKKQKTEPDNSSGGSSKPRIAADRGSKQKLRKVGPSASGSFRKTTGYFNKKLRVTSSSEFAS